jgi:hypothetical protein
MSGPYSLKPKKLNAHHFRQSSVRLLLGIALLTAGWAQLSQGSPAAPVATRPVAATNATIPDETPAVTPNDSAPPEPKSPPLDPQQAPPLSTPKSRQTATTLSTAIVPSRSTSKPSPPILLPTEPSLPKPSPTQPLHANPSTSEPSRSKPSPTKATTPEATTPQATTTRPTKPPHATTTDPVPSTTNDATTSTTKAKPGKRLNATDVCFAMDDSISTSDGINGPGSDPTGLRYTAVKKAIDFMATVLADPNIVDTVSGNHFGSEAPAWLALLPTNLRTSRALIDEVLRPLNQTLGYTNIPAALERCGQLLGGEQPGRNRSVLIATDGLPDMPDNPQLAQWSTIAGSIRFLGNTNVYVFGVDNGDPSIQAAWEAAGAHYIPMRSLTGPDLQRRLQEVLSREAFA